jgi:hypothetical protein
MTPKKPEWFELSEGDNSTPGTRKAKKKLPVLVAVAAGVAILGGAFLANAHDEPNANAATTSISAPSATPGASSASTAPSVPGSLAPVPQSTSVKRDGGDGAGEHRDGEHHDGEHRDD